MRILVTGAYGQLGSELKEIELNYPEYNFLFTDVDTLDISSETAIENYFIKNKPDYIINCAAYTAVDRAENDLEPAKKINALAPEIIGKFSKKIGAKIIHISTDYVFDGQANKPYSESDEVNPQGVYGRTKLEGEKNCLKENPDSIVIRTSWLYSEYGNNFVKTMLRFGKERDELKVVFDQVGTPTYAADLANTIMTIIENSEKKRTKFEPGIYHYSNEGVASWYDFAKAIFEFSGIECNVLPVLSADFPTLAKRPNYSVLDKKKIRETFGIEIPYWRTSLKDCIEKI